MILCGKSGHINGRHGGTDDDIISAEKYDEYTDKKGFVHIYGKNTD